MFRITVKLYGEVFQKEGTLEELNLLFEELTKRFGISEALIEQIK